MSAHAYLKHIDVLRGLAALYVAIYHYASQNAIFKDTLFGTSMSYGYTGVDMFFVISGFVLPYSLYAGKFELSGPNFLRFLSKRLMRLYPPFFIIFLAVFIYYWMINIHEGREIFWVPDFKGFLMHITLTAEIAGERWLSPVYWTLPIEIQFYIGIGLLYPLLLHRNSWVKVAIFAAYLGLFYIAPYARELMFKYVTIFGIGMILAYWKLGVINRGWMAGIILAGMVALVGYQKDIPSAVAVGFAVLFISFAGWEWPNTLQWLGKISYSLYLTHCLVGAMLFYEYHRLVPLEESNFYVEILIVLGSVAIDLGIAVAFYRFVEQPCAQWAKKI